MLVVPVLLLSLLVFCPTSEAQTYHGPQEFQNYMNKITVKLIPDYNPQNPNNSIQFYVQRNPYCENAWFAENSKGEKQIVFTSALLNNLKSEDEIAGLLAHELTHYKLDEKLGLSFNSKPEEAIADLLPLFMLKNAGYNPQAYLNVLKLLFKDELESKDEKRFFSPLHLRPENRILMVEAGLTKLYRDGDISANENITPVDDRIKRFIKVVDEPNTENIRDNDLSFFLRLYPEESIPLLIKLESQDRQGGITFDRKLLLRIFGDDNGDDVEQTSFIKSRKVDQLILEIIKDRAEDIIEEQYRNEDYILDKLEKYINILKVIDYIESNEEISYTDFDPDSNKKLNPNLFSGDVDLLNKTIENFLSANSYPKARQYALEALEIIYRNITHISSSKLDGMNIIEANITFSPLIYFDLPTLIDVKLDKKLESFIVKELNNKNYDQDSPIAKLMLTMGANDKAFYNLVYKKGSYEFFFNSQKCTMNYLNGLPLFVYDEYNFQLKGNNGMHIFEEINQKLEETIISERKAAHTAIYINSKAIITDPNDFIQDTENLIDNNKALDFSQLKEQVELYLKSEITRYNKNELVDLLYNIAKNIELLDEPELFIDFLIKDRQIFISDKPETKLKQVECILLAVSKTRKKNPYYFTRAERGAIMDISGYTPELIDDYHEFFFSELGDSVYISYEYKRKGNPELIKELLSFALDDFINSKTSLKKLSHNDLKEVVDKLANLYGNNGQELSLFNNKDYSTKIKKFFDKQDLSQLKIDELEMIYQRIGYRTETIFNIILNIFNKMDISDKTSFFSDYDVKNKDNTDLFNKLNEKTKFSESLAWRLKQKLKGNYEIIDYKYIFSMFKSSTISNKDKIDALVLFLEFTKTWHIEEKNIDKIYEMIKMIIKNEHDINIKINLIETSIVQMTKIHKLSYINELASLWVETVYKKYGDNIINNSNEYINSIKEISKKLFEESKIPSSIASNMIKMLAKKISAQKELSEYLTTSNLTKIDEHMVKNMWITTFLGEVALTEVDMSNCSTELFDYLTNPLTEKSLADITSVVYRKNMGLYASFRTPSLAFKSLYENFWVSPFEVKVAFIAKLLSSISNKDWDKMFDYIFDKTVNSNEPGVLKAKLALKYYVESIPEYSRVFFLSAFMVEAKRSSETGIKLNIPEALAKLAEFEDNPVIRKLAQQVHSNPSVPNEIRKAFSHFKGHSSEPSRAELWDLFNSNIPKEVRDNFEYLGKIIGSGKSFIVVEAKMNNNGIVAIRLMRSNADKKIENAYIVIKKAITKMSQDENLKDVVNVLNPLVENAYSQAKKELDMKLGAEQAETAYKQYNGARVVIDGKTIEFNPSKWIYYGENTIPDFNNKKLAYSIMELMPNRTFNDLKVENNELDFKTISKAIIAMELGYILTGNPIDLDPHGNNRNIYGNNTVGVFDYGERTNNPPSREAKIYLGKLLARIYNEAQKSDNTATFIADIFGNAIKETQSMNTEIHSYVSGIYYMMLALNDYFTLLDLESNEDASFIEEIFQAVNNANCLDETIKESFLSNLSTSKKASLGLKFLSSIFNFNKGVNKNSIVISFGEGDLKIKPDFKPLEESDMQTLVVNSKQSVFDKLPEPSESQKLLSLKNKNLYTKTLTDVDVNNLIKNNISYINKNADLKTSINEFVKHINVNNMGVVEQEILFGKKDGNSGTFSGGLYDYLMTNAENNEEYKSLIVLFGALSHNSKFTTERNISSKITLAFRNIGLISETGIVLNKKMLEIKTIELRLNTKLSERIVIDFNKGLNGLIKK